MVEWEEWIAPVIVVIAIVCGFVFLLAPFDFCFQSGRGTQSGYIAEVEETGYLWRPAIVRLLNIVPTYSEKDTMFDYGIEPELVDLAKGYQLNQSPCSVEYTIRHFKWDWEYSDIVVITNITSIPHQDENSKS